MESAGIPERPLRLAIVGSGISGLACAHLLGPHHDVVLFEADARLGGHANTVEVDDPVAGPVGVDTGFIVHNDRNYPNLVRLLAELDVETLDSEMSFAVTDHATGFTYRATNLDTLFANRRNALDRRMWRMLFDIIRFHRAGRRFLADPDPDPDLTIGQFLERGRYSNAFIELHLIPMGAAVWSATPTSFGRFPAATLLRFLQNHGLLSVGDRPQWRTIAGGSHRYLQAIARRFEGEVRLGTRVTTIRRTTSGVEVSSGSEAGTDVERFDQVILACHSDQALAALGDPSPEEREILAAVRYQPNRATLHTDISLLPPEAKAWAAWNYDRLANPAAQQQAVLTYDLTTLQHLPGSHRYLVSLNADDRIDPSTIIASFDYAHPVFDRAAIEAQSRLPEINGVAATWYCGAWQGNGFHEDGMTSAVAVSRELGATW